MAKVNTISTKKKEKFLFKVGDKVFYIGKMFEMYNNIEFEIVGRSTSKSKRYYKVKIAENKEFSFVENLLRKVEDVKDDII